MSDERRVAAALPALARLGSMRETRALGALGEAERARLRVVATRDGQRDHVERLRRELATAVARAVADTTPTVASLTLAAEHRGWLHRRLTQERGHLNELERELARAETIAAAARRDWLRARERAAALARRGKALARDAARRAENRADTDRPGVAPR